MIAFARFVTRFSISAATPAKVAKVAKVGAGEAGLSQLSQVSRGAIPETENPPPAGPVLTARRIAASIADGAEREDDPDGWLVLVRPDGRRHIVAPHTLAELDAAGLLPELPPAVPRSTYAARARPPSWSEPDDEPREGDRCCMCGSGRWWTATPVPDGWCCSTCHPPWPGRPAREIVT
jgi:hypothetical protein